MIRALQRDGYDSGLIHACHNRTVVIDARLGERENKQLDVVERHGLRNVHLYEGEDWVDIREAVGDLTQKFLCLNDVYPKGFLIPRRFIGENIIHLPTVKTHVFTTTTGAMKNAFGGLLNEHRHWTHPVIHETLVDLLMIQQKIHRGVFAVMDGTFAGDGPGPRCMVPHVKDVILASADQVAIDAVAAKLMGFDPLSIKFIRLAHDAGLGCGDPREIEIAGDHEAARENWQFVGPFKKMTFASRMQHKIYWGPLRKPWSGRSRRCSPRGPTSRASSTTTRSGTRRRAGRSCATCWPARGAACSRPGSRRRPTRTATSWPTDREPASDGPGSGRC